MIFLNFQTNFLCINANFYCAFRAFAKMRTVCFIKHLKLKIGGKVSQNCISLGDIDGDFTNELVLGVSGAGISLFILIFCIWV